MGKTKCSVQNKYHEPNGIRYLVPGTKYRHLVPVAPSTWYLVPCTFKVHGSKQLVLGTRCPVPGTMCLAPGTHGAWYQVPGAKYPALGIWNQAPCKCLAAGSLCQVSGTKYMVLGTCMVPGTWYHDTRHLVLGHGVGKIPAAMRFVCHLPL